MLIRRTNIDTWTLRKTSNHTSNAWGGGGGGGWGRAREEPEPDFYELENHSEGSLVNLILKIKS